MDRRNSPYVVGIGGALRAGSSTEAALRICLKEAEFLGARVRVFTGPALELPFYPPGGKDRVEAANDLIRALREADGVVIASPGYHGGVSGLVKNVLDYTEDLREDPRPYLDGLVVGCIATGAGWQGGASTLRALRDIVHALRGWPTPLGVVVNTIEPAFWDDGSCRSPALQGQLRTLASQVVRSRTSAGEQSRVCG